MPGHNMLYVGRHRHMTTLGYVSPYLLEILSTQPGAPPFPVATGSLTSLQGATVSCSRTASAYCLGNDGLLHLLGANTVRVEPSGLLVEGASTNVLKSAVAVGDANWTVLAVGVAGPTITLNSTDVLDPSGGNAATKLVYPATITGQGSAVYQADSATGGTTESVYLRCASGTTTFYLANQGAPVGGTHWITCNLTTTWQRFSIPGSTSFFIIGSDARGDQPGMAGQTVYAWGAQAEALPFATSLISTTSAAATRDADIVTVANPLASLGQPVPAWRMGGTYIPQAPWANIPDSPNVLLAAGQNAAANNSRLGESTVVGHAVSFDVSDNSSGLKSITEAGTSCVGSATVVCAGTDTSGGVMGITPSGSSVTGTGTGIISTFDPTLYIPTNIPNFRFWGHITDIVVNNA